MISLIIGWSYFICWSLSFYPQVVLNFNTSSVNGLSLDFVYLNLLGFLCYTIYTGSFLFSPFVKNQYLIRFGYSNGVQINDFAFAIHAFILSLVTFAQTLMYKDSMQPNQNVHKFTIYFIYSACISTLVLIVTLQFNIKLQIIDILYFLSYLKLVISLLKYIPQALMNYSRKSTMGFSITNIQLDLFGGILALLQTLFDSLFPILDWSVIFGNPVKLALALVSIGFDVIFIIQHYVLYGKQPVVVSTDTGHPTPTSK